MDQIKGVSEKLAEFYLFVSQRLKDGTMLFNDDVQVKICKKDFYVVVSNFLAGTPVMMCIYESGVIEPALCLNVDEKGEVTVVDARSSVRKAKKADKKKEFCLGNYVKEDVAIRASRAVLERFAKESAK